jgi:copper chaperone NosL
MNKLTITSRILIAFASGALVSVFFLPAWRIDLFAPQYPEGLVMKIWINNITGDVDIINGLNHYIGMKHITVDMFPEFKFLPYIVGFFMLLGVIVAITGSRKFLFAYLVLTAIGGFAAIYDFYKWGYDYGHNLDPKAPIQVPGLSYQPPIFGHKRLLNFDAYSFPDVAGWVVIGAGVLSFGVWFMEWLHEYRMKKKPGATKLKDSAIATALAMSFFFSCTVKPEPFLPGKDMCSNCKMSIVDLRFGGETITTKGKVYKFDDLECMTSFLQSGVLAEKDIKQNVVMDFEKQNHFVAVQNAYFLKSPELRSPMGSNTAAFESKDAAQRVNIKGEVLDWKSLREQLK